MFEVIGQEFSMGLFKRAFESGKISHAYIILGPDGIGKSVFASFMAAFLLCTGSKKPCAACSSCQKLLKNLHPDYKVIASNKKSIGVDEVRDFIKDMQLKPYEGSRKVFVIKDASTMTIQAQNAILKTLEEPEEDVVIIMLADNLNSMLETILSRCQIIRLGRIPLEKVKNYLLKQGIEEKKADIASSLSDGIIGKALSFIETKYIGLRNDTVDIARKLSKCSILDAMELAEFFNKNKDRIDEVFDIMISWYRDIAVLKLTDGAELIINKDFYDLLVEQSSILSYNKLDTIVSILKSAKEKLRQNANFQLTLEVMLLNIQEV